MRSSVNVLTWLILAAIWVTCDTENNVKPVFKDYFITYYGEDGDQEGRDIVINPDGTMLLLGSTKYASQVSSILVVKTDATGSVLWQKRLGTTLEDPRDVEPVTVGNFAGNYVVLSNTKKSVGDSTLVKLIIIDQNGNKLDSVEYNYHQSQYGYSVTPTLDGGFIVTGNASPEAFNDGAMAVTDLSDLLSFRVNDNLSPVTWPTDFGGEGDMMGIKYFEASPSEHYFAAYTNKLLPGEPDVPSSYDYNFWFNKVTTVGNVTNRIQFFEGSGVTHERLSWITGSPSGIYLAVGTLTNSEGDPSVVLTKVINGFSLVEFSRSFSTGFEGVHACSYGVNRFLVVGNQFESGTIKRNMWLAKVNPALDIEFQTTFGGTGTDDRASAVAELPNGDIVILGTMNLVNQDKIALIKVKASGRF